MRPIQATIDLGALRHNLNVVRQHAPNARVMAVIKANGYGHGLLHVAQGLQSADGFAVLNIEEAIALREAGYRQRILLLEGFFTDDEIALAASHDITVVLHADWQLDLLARQPQGIRLPVFIKLNTGMNRLGFMPAALTEALARIDALPMIDDITLMTHFATADEPRGIAEAHALFEQATAGLAYPRSMANSATILRYPQAHADWVRPGIMLYGASPVSGTPAAQFGLRPAMALTSELIAVQTLQPGDSVGYGMRYTAEKPTRIGIVACGYADGYPRHAGLCAAGERQPGAPIAVAGKLTHTVGRVSMDMLFADITDIPEADIGSPVELWGAQVPVDAVAEASGTVGYELLCALAPRVPVRVID
ncbi:MAG TPA: alanine racemase [Methylophilaceae bacterium]|nr:alanine racemase [Methylophilaceae bacterium]